MSDPFAILNLLLFKCKKYDRHEQKITCLVKYYLSCVKCTCKGVIILENLLEHD